MNLTLSQWNNSFSAACNFRTFAVMLCFVAFGALVLVLHLDFIDSVLAQGWHVNMEFSEKA